MAVLAAMLAVAVLAPPAEGDIVHQSANGVLITDSPGGKVIGFGYRRQLVDISNCYRVGEKVGGNAFWGLQTNLSTGIQGYVNDYYLGGRCAG